MSFEPDGAMYAHARADFPDLRVVDADGTQVPWRTEPLPAAVLAAGRARRPRARPATSCRWSWTAAPCTRVIDRIELEIPDRDFVGAVEVLGSATGAEGSYATLSTTQIYAVRGAVDARSTTALFPPTDYRYLLVRARGVSDITGATVARDPLQPPPRAGERAFTDARAGSAPPSSGWISGSPTSRSTRSACSRARAASFAPCRSKAPTTE